MDAVLGYFVKRRQLASATMRMHPGEVPLDLDRFDEIWDVVEPGLTG